MGWQQIFAVRLLERPVEKNSTTEMIAEYGENSERILEYYYNG